MARGPRFGFKIDFLWGRGDVSVAVARATGLSQAAISRLRNGKLGAGGRVVFQLLAAGLLELSDCTRFGFTRKSLDGIGHRWLAKKIGEHAADEVMGRAA